MQLDDAEKEILINDEVLEKINTLDIQLKKYNERKDVGIHPFDIAVLLDELKSLDEDAYTEALNRLPGDLLADVLVELPKLHKEEIYTSFGAKKLAKLTESLDTDDAAVIIQHIEKFDDVKAEAVMSHLSDESRDTIQEIIAYKDDQAGSYMQTELFQAHISETIASSIERFKKMKENREIDNVHHVFVVSDEQKFIGMIPLEDLILFETQAIYRDVIKEGKVSISVSPYENIRKVVKIVDNYSLSVIPVVNDNGVLMGRITADDIYGIIKEDATGQIYRLAGVKDTAEEEESIWKISRARGFWLGISLLTSIAASVVIGLFDATLQSLVALAILMPIVSAIGGNAGSQALTVTVRRMALGDIDISEAKRTIFKEISISLINGAVLAVAMGIIAYFWFHMPMLGVVMGMAIVINLLTAGFFGAVIPLSLKKFGVDPAIGSTALLITVTDIIGFFSFLGLATIILL